MPLASNIALARVLARGTGMGVSEFADIEEREEREAELARAIRGQERGRRAQRGLDIGGLLGSILGGGAGFLGKRALLSAAGGVATGGAGTLISLLPTLLSVGGGFVGRKAATRKVARKRLPAVGVGTFQRARGRERETEFRAGERAFREDLESAIRGGAVSDFMSALAFQSLLPALGGGKRGVSFGIKQSLPLGDLPGPFLPRSLAGLSDIDRRGILSILQSLSPR